MIILLKNTATGKNSFNARVSSLINYKTTKQD